MMLPAVLPIGYVGHVRVPDWGGSRSDVLRAAELVEAAISQQSPRSLHRKDASIDFRGGLFRLLWPWNILLGITRGRIDVRPFETGIELSYRLHFTELLLFTTVGVLFVAWFPLHDLHLPTGVTIDETRQFRRQIAITVVGWLGIFGMGVATLLIRFPAFLRRAIKGR